MWSGNREQGTGNTGRKTELISTESCMATTQAIKNQIEVLQRFLLL
ncbi:MAG: hypothetical protein ACK57R_06060 [Dolichospermum sp.]